MSSWVTRRIKDIAIGVYDGPHATPPTAEEGPVFLGIGNVTDDGHLDLASVRHIAEADFEKWTKRVTPTAGDIVFTYEATLNRYAIIPEGFRGCLGRRMALIRPDTEQVDTRFLFYSFFSRAWRDTIEANRLSGATVDRIPLTRFPEFPILLPPLETQRRIAGILGAYDDLIEVNRRRVAVLEEMARGLFEEWFVRFRFPGHEQVPLLDTPNGPLPQGWGFEALGNVAEINATSLRPAKAPAEIGYIDIASVSPGQIDAINRMAFADAPGRARRLVRDGSILWSNVRPNRRSHALVIDPEPNIVASTGFTVLDARLTSFAYLYHWVTSDSFVGYLVGNASGAAYPAVTAAVFSRAVVLLPPSHLLEAFTKLAEANIRQAACLRKTNIGLAASRDLLLPRLISGQLSLEAAEKELENAA